MDDRDTDRQSDRVDQGLPGEPSHNREDNEPTEPERKHPDDAGGGDPGAGGESGEGSQSTGDPNSAG